MKKLSSIKSNVSKSRLIDYTFKSTVPVANNTFTSNTLTVSNSAISAQNGTYIISASSYNTNYYPYIPFNPSASSFWHTQYETPYTQLAYNNGTYVGGGTGFYYSTITSTSTFNGEWIQIQVPYNFKLATYTMTQRICADRYIKSLAVVGSNDGTSWTLIEERTGLPESNNTATYTLTTAPQYYKYFRIVFTSLAPYTNGIAINITGLSFTGTGP